MKETTLCPCGSHRPLTDCCAPVHQNPSAAHHPEQLMRARYSAHVLGLVDFVVATYHPSCKAEQYRDAIAESVHSEWLRLEVCDSQIASETEGYVEFKAFYQEQGEKHCLHEKSRFLREMVGNSQQWFYIDGEYPENAAPVKVGRNDPCPCGSGKKFKKCCM
ncbi:YchJ family metal-binding protein [Photobacterium sp. CCB-ST2H9]|uniref:YchJ family metal-binding protein n=1 Tax=Photobacterium sp. CCB-ST2H9 TaxID=2912855 RepID=UPI002004D75A|nr:YchJ family metal-binding protein [Photobacterium sp. CCB-ST2H9]UTM56357.1 YchJ family metal-binding protein [Photobacterium sp. CCB-ST2H9]